MRVFDERGQPLWRDYIPGENLPPGYSIKPFFPGYSFDGYKSFYKGVEVGEGGYVYAEPGIYRNVALLDIASMHPSSIVAEELFGPYTKNFQDLLLARIYIKHKEYEKAGELLDGKLKRYLDDAEKAASLEKVLKIPINSVYGLTSARFDNPFHDERNLDNIVAKRGALFMVNLCEQVQQRGYTVAHIKTDSIKIPNADDDIIRFVMDYGKEFGYNFEHEAVYDRMCLVNDAVYIAKYDDKGVRNKGNKHANEWTATGTQFAVPFVFKSLFSHEPITFEDVCETKSVNTALYLDMDEALEEGKHDYRFVGKVGLFSPILPGKGGGKLMRETVNKDGSHLGYASATGAKDYRWRESTDIADEWENFVDFEYYYNLVDKAKEAISTYGDVEQFLEE